MLAVSTRLGPYEIVDLLGAGGMGEVYRARDTRLGREIAIKVLAEPFASDVDRLARFEREARAVAALSHPNILAIHDYGTSGSVTYAVMELLEGQTLRCRLADGPMAWSETVEIGAAIAEGLAAAHAKGIVHRDLKPENLLLTTDGRPKILDFGLARLVALSDSKSETRSYVAGETAPGTVLGTAGYMSPEQVRGQLVDGRSDLFSFGCILYEMLAGRRAFQRDTAADTLVAILHEDPPKLTRLGVPVPPEVERLISRCLRKDRDERYGSARELALALRTILAGSRSQAPSRPRLSRRFLLTAAVIIIGLSVALGMLRRGSKPPNPGPLGEMPQALGSLAIVPLVNMTGDPKAEPLCDGIADHVASSLAQVHDRKLRVRPITSTSHYKGLNVDAKTIGIELDVEAVATGRLRQQGSDLMIALELVDARENNLVWSRQYQRNINEILLLQDEIARDVAFNMGLQLTGDEQKQLSRRYTNDPAAYLRFREGRYHWDKSTEEDLELAANLFQAAIDKDPKYALAYAWQAHAYNVLGHFYRPADESWPRAKELAGKALMLDEGLAEGHTALGAACLLYDRDLARATRELREAVRLDPKNPGAHHVLGYCLAAAGQLSEAVAESERAVKEDPLSPFPNGALARVYVLAKRDTDAIDAANKALAISPALPNAHAALGLAYAHLGRHELAVNALENAVKSSRNNPCMLGLLGCAYGLSGKRPDAERILKQLLDLSARRPFRAYGIAAVYAGLDQKDRAFNWLNQACDNHDGWIVFLSADPQWANLRQDRRFNDLLRRAGLRD